MNSLIIDSTRCMTSLCRLCAEHGTDKGPYCLNGHRHPYTAPYSLFFEPLRHKNIKLAEIGVYRGASVQVWRKFFSKARIWAYDNDVPNLYFIAALGIKDVTVGQMDASKGESISSELKKATEDGELFDVIMDDASHDPNDQCEVIKNALPFLKQGGMLIIEDIFRDRTEEPYEKALASVQDMVSFHTFIICDHNLRYSPGWNNDKMLIIIKA